MKKAIYTLYFFFVVVIAAAQSNSSNVECGNKLTDPRDGKQYATVKIGNQCWMAENINIGKPVDNLQQTDNQVIEKSCYDNNPENCKTYGGLYIWNEAMQWQNTPKAKGICPEGWHIPSNEEWTELNQYLGIDSTGQKMKVTKTHTPPWDGTNESGFTALPAGNGYKKHYGRLEKHAYFWTSTQRDDEYAWFTHLDNYWYPAPPKYLILYQGNYYLKANGFSIRCIQDK